jgi:predicted YcjX-like family ATPase
LAASRRSPRVAYAKDFHDFLGTLDGATPGDEQQARKAAQIFTSYLSRCRADDVALSALPPGRFLMPGDLEGSPLLTFAPLDIDGNRRYGRGSLLSLMEQRYDAYVAHVVKPFFINHFARLDRQIVLVDVLSALNAGTEAVADLKSALTAILSVYRQGSNSWAAQVLGRRIDHILFAATKADQLHHVSHDRLEAILGMIIKDAAARAEFRGAKIDVSALAAIRATREATVRQRGEDLPCIVGTPERGERIGGNVFDGDTEAAIFPGDLPEDPQDAHDRLRSKLRFVRFRPPVLRKEAQLGAASSFPHIRLDRALEFLLGDRLT